MYGFSYRELYEKGFSVDTLENARKFYLNYQGRISETLFRKFIKEKSDTLFRISGEKSITISLKVCRSASVRMTT